MKHTYTREYLQSLPTLHVGQYDDLKVETEDMRIWVSRLGVEDGATVTNEVTIERLYGGRWNTVETW